MAAVELGSTTLFSDANLVHYYKLEDANDNKGATNLTNNGTTAFNAAKFNNGADGGATNSTKSLTAVSSMGVGGAACTVNFWVKLSAEIAAGTWVFFTIYDAASKISYFARYNFNGGSRTLDFGRDFNTSADASTYASGALGTVNFNMISFTYDGTNIRGYVNGVLVAGPTSSTTAGSGASFASNIFSLLAGSRSDTGALLQWTSGIIDDCSIFSRVLSATELLSLYTGPTASGASFLLNFV